LRPYGQADVFSRAEVSGGVSLARDPGTSQGVYAGEGDSVRAVQGTNILLVTHSFDKLGRTEQNHLKVSWPLFQPRLLPFLMMPSSRVVPLATPPNDVVLALHSQQRPRTAIWTTLLLVPLRALV